MIGKTKVFSDLIKLKEVEEFKWGNNIMQLLMETKATFLSPPF